ncbi:MAG: DegT/DnrJ/EryC1/StrS family aminotransferase, partial [Caldilineae bacterium]
MSSTLALHGGTPVRTKPWPRWPRWDDRVRAQLLGVLERGEWGGFDEAVGRFEAAFAQRHAAKHCITTVNGTTSLETALRVLGVGPGDEVIVPPYTFIATASAVRVVGATPVFADVALDTWNLSIPAVEAALSPRTKAIIPVHFGGLPVDMDALLALAKRHGVAVIEDAAHAHGSSWRGRPVGALGTVGSFSFQTSKNLTAGEGGALLTDDDDLAAGLRSFVNCGRGEGGPWYAHPNLGSNLRLSGWQAAVLLAGLERLDEELSRRMASARRLRSFLEEVDGLTPQAWDSRADAHAHHIFIMRYDQARFGDLPREQFILALRAEGIPASPGYPIPLYQQPPLAAPFSRVTPCPNTEQLCQETVWLGQNVLLAEPEEMDDIAAAILKVREHVEEL